MKSSKFWVFKYISFKLNKYILKYESSSIEKCEKVGLFLAIYHLNCRFVAFRVIKIKTYNLNRYKSHKKNLSILKNQETRQEIRREETINVVLATCGNKLFNLSANFLKTSFMFTKRTTKFTFFASQENKDFILNEVKTNRN